MACDPVPRAVNYEGPRAREKPLDFSFLFYTFPIFFELCISQATKHGWFIWLFERPIKSD